MIKNKISEDFAERLYQLGPEERIRVIVLPYIKKNSDMSSRGTTRQTPVLRRAAVENVREAASAALKDIDAILDRVSGRRLQEKPSALGSILVETTASGVYALAALEDVNAIIEDQGISLMGG